MSFYTRAARRSSRSSSPSASAAATASASRASTSRPGRSSPTRSSRSPARTPRRSARAPSAAPRAGLMLTGDENIVDITFQVVWNVRDPTEFLFNLSDPTSTIQAVAESAMREVVSRSQLSPILSRDRGMISQEVKDLIQQTLDEYGSGVNIVRVNFDKADPPQEVIDSLPRGAGGAPGALDAAEPGRRLRQPDARRARAATRRRRAAGGRGLPRPGGQRRPGRGQPLHRGRAGVRQGAGGDPQAALSRDDGERARRRADVPARHAVGRRPAASCPTCRSTSSSADAGAPRRRQPERPSDAPPSRSSSRCSSPRASCCSTRSTPSTSGRRRWCCSSARSARSRRSPGLAFKIPFIQNVVYLRQPHPGPRHQRAGGDAARRPAADRRRLRPLADLRRQPVPPRRRRRRHDTPRPSGSRRS